MAEEKPSDPVEAWIAAQKAAGKGVRIDPGNHNWAVQIVRIGEEAPKGRQDRSGQFGALIYVRREGNPDEIHTVYCPHEHLVSLKKGGCYKFAAYVVNSDGEAAFLYRSTGENPQDPQSRRPTHKVDSRPQPCEAFELPPLTGAEKIVGGRPSNFSFRERAAKKSRTP